MNKLPVTVYEIGRNDVRACERFYAAHGVTADEMQVMLMLQDDPTRLLGVAQRWRSRPDRR